MAKQGSSLLDAIERAGQEDLAQIREEIAEAEKRLAALKQAEKLLDVKLNGKPAARRGAGKGKSEQLAERIYDIITENGPLPASEIARLLGGGTTAQAVGLACGKSEWFAKTVSGDWEIARSGS